MLEIHRMNFAAFDLNLLRVFNALMRERNVTRAGERIGLSQPAVSAALNRLRAAFGDELFVRNAGQMEPTPRAIALAEPIGDALRRVELVIGSSMPFEAASTEREFVLWGIDYVSYLLAPPLLASLSRTAPGIVIRLIDGRVGSIEQLLEAGEIDLAVEVMHELADPIRSQFLFEERYVVIAAAGHPDIDAGGASVPPPPFDLELYCRLPHVQHSLRGGVSGNVDAALAAIGRRRHVAFSLPHFFTIAQAVAASSRMIATFPERLAQAVGPAMNLRIFEVPIELAPISLAMIWHRRNDNDAAHLWLRQQVMSVAQALA
jgi:DNA-binding transcriptional LysR family regulator